ncbi:MAG: TonB-dependent receptor [Proteobacteria bacterium]|nr:TonB-dependent receptor [Pseudomonadota bacterium]
MKAVFFLAAMAAISPQTVAACCEDDKARLQQIVVTATREKQSLASTLAPVLVIDRDEIELSLARDLADLLRFHAGLEISRNGGTGQTTSVFVRGTDSNHVLVMIDGIKINPGTIGGAAIQNIRPQMIERIEIVKGPRTSLYGSDAIGGVINVITRKADGKVEFNAGGGRYGTYDRGVAVSWQDEGNALYASFSRFDTDGFPVRTGSSVDRGYDNNSARLQGNTRLGKLDLELSFWQASGTSEYLDFFAQPVSQDYRNQTLSLGLGFAPDENWSSRITLAQLSDDIDQNDSMDFVRTERTTLDWYNSFAIGDNQLLSAGIYLSREHAESLSFGTGFDRDRDDYAFYLQDQFGWDRHQLLLAMRYGDFESFGGISTWNIEYGYLATDSLMLTASLGTGFRAPDATDLFGFGGNPDLQAEESRNVELGLRWQFTDYTSLSVQAFENDIDNLIQFVVIDPATFAGQNRNVAKARISGLEMTWRFRNDGWDLRSSLVFQDPQNISDNQQLLRRSKRSLTLGITRHLQSLALGFSLLATDQRKDFGFPAPVDIGGYTLLNFNGRFTIGKHWQLSLKVENLLDKEYQTAAGFNSSKRAAFMALNYLLPAK